MLTVSDILTVPEGDIKPAPDNNADNDTRFVTGLIAVEGRMVVLLDIAVLLARDEDLIDTTKSLKA
jgi:purine-binding chemotaxis protein CheW